MRRILDDHFDPFYRLYWSIFIVFLFMPIFVLNENHMNVYGFSEKTWYFGLITLATLFLMTLIGFFLVYLVIKWGYQRNYKLFIKIVFLFNRCEQGLNQAKGFTKLILLGSLFSFHSINAMVFLVIIAMIDETRHYVKVRYQIEGYLFIMILLSGILSYHILRLAGLV